MNETNNRKTLFIIVSVVLALIIMLIVYIVVFKVDFNEINYKSKNSFTSSVSLAETVSSDVTEKPQDSSQITSVPSGTAPADYLKNSVFIGDFIPVALALYTEVPDKNVFADVNINLGNLSTAKIKVDKKSITTIKAVKEKNPQNIYISVGSNDLSWKSESVVISDCSAYIRKIKDVAPDANIYIMGMPPVSEPKNSTDNDYNNKKVKAYNSYLEKVAGIEGAYYLDIYTALAGDDGVLPSNLAESDGYHIKATGCKLMLDYVLSHVSD